MQGQCEACGNLGVMDRAHIKSKGSGGSWDWENILLLCRKHHSMSHQYGWLKFCEQYPHVERALAKRGWVFVEEFGVMKLRREK